MRSCSKRAHKAWHRCRERLGEGRKTYENDVAQGVSLLQEQNFEQSRAFRLFTESFSARDIAEPLGSFDSDTSAIKAHEILFSKGWNVAGLREEALTVGYIMRNDLQRGYCGDYRRDFAPGQVVEGDASFTDVIHVLTRHNSCFVNIIGSITGIILREHMQKPLVRMWLFGMITIIEINVVKRIEQVYPDASWKPLLTSARLAKAVEIREERLRRGQNTGLLDCLQLSDKIQILIKEKENLNWMGFDSKRVARKMSRDLESLRNNLAHAQDIISHDWPQIARMTRRIETLLGFAEE